MNGIRRNIKGLGVALVTAAGVSLLIAPSAFADTVMTPTSPSGGDPSVDFLLSIPGGAQCPSATANPGGDSLYTFLVDKTQVSTAHLDSMTFSAATDLPSYGSYSGGPMVTSGGAPVSNVATLPPSTSGGPGDVPAADQGAYNWEAYSGAYGGGLSSGNPLYPGTFYIGIACVTPSGTVDTSTGSGSLWYSTMSVTGATFSNMAWTTLQPKVTKASPKALGQNASKAKVTITGTDFASGAKVSSSNSGLTFSSTTFVSSTQLTTLVTVTKTAATGALTLTVTDPGGAKGTCGKCLTIDAGPTITNRAPTTLTPGQATVVTFTGTQFVATPKITVSGTGITVSNITFVSSTSVKATFTVTSSATAGSRTVTVTNPDKGRATTTLTVS